MYAAKNSAAKVYNHWS